MKLEVSSLNIRGAMLEGENPLPFFRDRIHNKPMNFIEPYPPEKKQYGGYETGFRILPYRMQDRYSRKCMPLLFKNITLENEYLKASFLPEAGGRLISLVDKKYGRELLSCNPMFQPANLAIRNAWISGGIEWNIGQLGHAFHTCSPVFAVAVNGRDGEQFLRIYEFERCKRLFWQVDFHLPSGSRLLYAYTRVVNPNETDVPMYWWTNIAVPQTPDARIFAPADDVIFIDPKHLVSPNGGYGYARMPVLPSLPGKDFSYPYNSDFASEYFFQCPEISMPWEAAVYKEGETFFEVSTARLRYRKMFCWGNHEGGKHWQEFLSGPETEYIEIQAGLAPTQSHGMDMPRESVWEWTQAFGGTTADREKSHDKDWFAACAHIEEKILDIIPERELYAKEALFREEAVIKPLYLLHEGPGWGALEYARMLSESGSALISGLTFPLSTVKEEQYPWLHLLQSGFLPEKDPGELPGAWMVQREWKKLLDKSLEKAENRNWYALLHAGIMAFEEGDGEGAEKLWTESANSRPSVWAIRNLAVAAKIKGDMQKSLDYMKNAWEIIGTCPDQALAEEYLSLLIDFKMYREAWNIFEGLPESIRTAERVSLTMGMAAMELGIYEYVEKLFNRSYAVIREGEIILTDLWFRYHAAMLAKKRGAEVSRELLDEVRLKCPPPSGLDFRMTN